MSCLRIEQNSHSFNSQLVVIGIPIRLLINQIIFKEWDKLFWIMLQIIKKQTNQISKMNLRLCYKVVNSKFKGSKVHFFQVFQDILGEWQLVLLISDWTLQHGTLALVIEGRSRGKMRVQTNQKGEYLKVMTGLRNHSMIQVISIMTKKLSIVLESLMMFMRH